MGPLDCRDQEYVAVDLGCAPSISVRYVANDSCVSVCGSTATYTTGRFKKGIYNFHEKLEQFNEDIR